MNKLLIVDDESLMLNALGDTLEQKDYKVLKASSPEKAIKLLNSEQVSILITDMKMPNMDGLSLVKLAKEKQPSIVPIVMTAYGTVDNAVAAMKQGVFDYIEKPFSFDKIELIIERALNTHNLLKENIVLKDKLSEKENKTDFIGSSPSTQKILTLVNKVSEINITVLISGESGTGKEVIANSIYSLSNRNDKPFIKLNCAALPETLLESELFGHVKGAFTGAINTKKGKFELADGGTIFLDEIGEMSLGTQVKLLRVLQEKTIEPVGSEKSLSIDVRVIAATNKNLEDEIKNGRFREDLFYRLNVFNINIPPLRERKEDIPLLINHTIAKFEKELGIKCNGLSRDSLSLLLDYSWPGNVRELENIIQRGMVLSNGSIISPDSLPDKLKDDIIIRSDDTISSIEKQHIIYILNREKWNMTKCSNILGIDRKTLYNKLAKYNIGRPDGKNN